MKCKSRERRAPEFTGELVVAKLVEQLGLNAPDELAFARAAIDGVAQSAPAQRPTVRLEPHLTNGRERRFHTTMVARNLRRRKPLLWGYFVML